MPFLNGGLLGFDHCPVNHHFFAPYHHMRLQLPGTSFSAWILVEGAEVDIYEPTYSDDQSGAIARCWISSEAGKNFGICWRDSERMVASDGFVYVDGVQCTSKLLLRKGESMRDTAQVLTVQTSNNTARYLTFSCLETTDDDVGVTNAEVASIGEIKVVIKQVETRISNNQAQDGPQPGATMLGQNKKVNEKSKKAGSHRTQLGAEVALEKITFHHILRDIAQVGTFIFCYRSHDILMAQDIIPRPIEQPRSPDPGSGPDADDDNADEDIVESEITKLQEKLKKLENIRESKRKRVKAEPDTNTSRVKRERLNVPPIVQGEVLDLTELSD